MSPDLSTSGLPMSDVTELTHLYASAVASIRQVVLHPPGGTAASRDFRQARAAHLVRQIDGTLAGLRAGTAAWVGVNLPAAFRDGIARGEQQAKAAGVDVANAPLRGTFAAIDHGTVQQFVRDTTRDLTTAADAAGERAKSLLRRTAQMSMSEADLNRVLAGGAIAGTPTQTTRDLRDAFRRVSGDTVLVNGRSYDAAEYASLVVRTKTRQATVLARHERLEGLGLDLVAIVGRVSKYFCTAFLGQVFSLGGKSGRYPSLAELPGGGPPFHPNCSKPTRPFVEDLASPKQLDQADGLPDAQQMLGVTPTDAQRRFKDLQLHAQVKDRYPTTAKQLYGSAA